MKIFPQKKLFAQGLATEEEWKMLEKYALSTFRKRKRNCSKTED